MSYNIHGLENKLLFVDFFNYIKNFDIFALLETHVCLENTRNFNKFFGNFDLCWKPALRNSPYGRGIGGCLIGVKKELKKNGLKYTFENKQGIDFIKININAVQYHLIPLYMRGATWKEDFINLDLLMKENDLINPIVIGDLNVRIGKLQKNIDDIFKTSFVSGTAERKSKDSIDNAKGREFIQFCYDYGLVITNGMTSGDENGEFTFVSGVGESVNDICAVSQDFLAHIQKF